MFPGFPPTGVIVLAGISGSGKSTWARAQFPGAHVLSSDALRGVITDDESHQECSPDAFDVLGELAGLRLKYKRLAIVDATNLKVRARKPWLELARKHDVPAVIVWFDTPPEVAAKRQLKRERRVPVEVISRQARNLADLQRDLLSEPWDGVVRVIAEGDAGAAPMPFEVLRAWTPPMIASAGTGGVRVNRRDFDIVGDVHGCLPELHELMGKLGWVETSGRWRHPEDRFLIFVGDLTDRGPDSLGVLELVSGLVEEGRALLVLGNHDDKLRRYLRGNNVKLTHGLQTTAAEFAALPLEKVASLKKRYLPLLEQAPLWALCDPRPDEQGARPLPDRVVIAHAAWKPSFVSASFGKVRSHCLYGPTTGNVVNGLPQRLDWKPAYPEDAPFCVVGHTAFKGPVVVRHNTTCIDTACVFGGALTALRWPSREVVQVAARATYDEKSNLAEAPVLIDPDHIPAAAPSSDVAPPTSLGLKAEVPALEMLQVDPDKAFDLRMDRLFVRLHEHPEEVLGQVHEDPKLLKRQPTEGPHQPLILANASKLLFSPEHVHQVYAKGLIYSRDPWRAVSVPYLKMYNYGERQDSFELANELAADPKVRVRFNEKLDGTMIQLFSTARLGLGKPQVLVTTRGMMDGATPSDLASGMFDYLGHARAILQAQSPRVLDPQAIAGLTLLWEFIHPEARIVTDYGERQELVLTGAVDFRDGPGRYIPRDELEQLAADLGAPIADEMKLPGDGLAERLDALREVLAGTDHEGAVLTFEGLDVLGRPAVLHRVKVKGADYLRLMRLFAYCTYDRTRDFLENNPELTSWAKFREFLMRQGSDEVPEEVLSTYRQHFEVWQKYRRVCVELVKVALSVYTGYTESAPRPSRDDAPDEYRAWRKAFAAWAGGYGRLSWYFFSLADDRLNVELLHARFRGDHEAAQAALSDLQAL